jgi:hypothetical protein
MTRIIIQDVNHKTFKKKDGSGSYEKTFITTSTGKEVSGFTRDHYRNFKAGDEIDVVIETNEYNGKTYYNFTHEESKKTIKQIDLEERVAVLEDAVKKLVARHNNTVVPLDADDEYNNFPSYPSDEINPDDIPF